MTAEYREATPSSVRKLLVETFEAITGLQSGRVLIEGMNDRRPSEGLYCTLWFREARPEDHNVIDFLEDSESGVPYERLLNQMIETVQVSFWGRGARDMAIETLSRLDMTDRFCDLWRIIGFAGIDSLQDIPTGSMGQMRERSLFNLRFYVCYGRKYPAKWFEVEEMDVVWVRPGNDEIKFSV